MFLRSFADSGGTNQPQIQSRDLSSPIVVHRWLKNISMIWSARIFNHGGHGVMEGWVGVDGGLWIVLTTRSTKVTSGGVGWVLVAFVVK